MKKAMWWSLALAILTILVVLASAFLPMSERVQSIVLIVSFPTMVISLIIFEITWFSSSMRIDPRVVGGYILQGYWTDDTCSGARKSREGSCY